MSKVLKKSHWAKNPERAEVVLKDSKSRMDSRRGNLAPAVTT